jgi:hypothetical protein
MDEKKDCQEHIARKWTGGKQNIEGIKYDIEDPNTRLIGYGDYASYLTEQTPPPAFRLYYNTRDAKYFLHKHTKEGKIEPLHAADGRHYMDHGFDQCIDEDEKEEIKRKDGLNKQ